MGSTADFGQIYCSLLETFCSLQIERAPQNEGSQLHAAVSERMNLIGEHYKLCQKARAKSILSFRRQPRERLGRPVILLWKYDFKGTKSMAEWSALILRKRLELLG